MNAHQRRTRLRATRGRAFAACARFGLTPSADRLQAALDAACEAAPITPEGIRQLQALAAAYAPNPSDYERSGPNPRSGAAHTIDQIGSGAATVGHYSRSQGPTGQCG